MEETRIWQGLGVVDTIHEGEDEDECSTNLSVSPDQTISSTSLNSMVQAWSRATGQSADVVINIHDLRLFLHKDPLTMRSGYFRQHLKGVSQLALPTELKITAETFTLVAEFCYGANLVLTPVNIAPLRVAAELLEMTEPDDSARCESLSKETEDYFRHAISLNREYANLMFRSSLSLFPEAEVTARLVSRCIVALSLMGDDNGVMKCLANIEDAFLPDDFELIVESLHQRLTSSHDILYKIIDNYLKEHTGKLSEEQKSRICNYIDCASLSPQLLMDAVQNPRMPLRFIVQAMFVEQINTRRSVLCAADRNNSYTKHQPVNANAATLGAILQRDAALREVAQLKAAMNVTSSRIQSVEKELSSMREIVQISNNSVNNSLHSGRSSSFRVLSENKVDRGQVGSISSGNLGIFSRKDRGGRIMSPSESYGGESTPTLEKRYGRRLVNGVKNAFKLPSFLSSKKKIAEERGSFLNKDEKRKVAYRNEDVVMIPNDLPFEKPSS